MTKKLKKQTKKPKTDDEEDHGEKFYFYATDSIISILMNCSRTKYKFTIIICHHNFRFLRHVSAESV